MGSPFLRMGLYAFLAATASVIVTIAVPVGIKRDSTVCLMEGIRDGEQMSFKLQQLTLNWFIQACSRGSTTLRPCGSTLPRLRATLSTR